MRGWFEEGVAVHEETPVTAVEKTDEGVALVCGEGEARQRFSGSHLLVAVGRRPKIEGLGLEEGRRRGQRRRADRGRPPAHQ